jgi:hypothetical protein
MRCEIAYRFFFGPVHSGLIWFGWMRISCGLCVCGLEEGLGCNIKRGGKNAFEIRTVYKERDGRVWRVRISVI